MPGPVPTPPARRARGRKGPVKVKPKPRALARRAAKSAGPVPEPPVKWLAVTKEAWTEYWTSPVAGHVVSSDLAGLRRLFEFIDMQERFLRAGMKSPTVFGSTGQLVLHPLVKAGMDLEPKIIALADRYGAHPKGRLALTVNLGDAARSIADATNEDVLASDAAPVDLYAMDGGAG